VTGNAWEIARILEPHVARVLVFSPSDSGIRQARAKTDRLDARTLARLLASGELDAVWMPDRATWVMRRRLSRRGQLVWARYALRRSGAGFEERIQPAFDALKGASAQIVVVGHSVSSGYAALVADPNPGSLLIHLWPRLRPWSPSGRTRHFPP
jgi:hypothetical protein